MPDLTEPPVEATGYHFAEASFSKVIDPDSSVDVYCYLSTDLVDDDDEVMLPQGADLGRFEKNGPLLISHDYAKPVSYYPLPVGQVVGVKRRTNGVLGGIRFARTSEMGKEAKALVDEGILRGVSIGFRPLESSLMTKDEAKSRKDWQKAFDRTNGQIRVHRKWKLLELSLVAIPCNEDALIQALKAKGLTRPSWVKAETRTRRTVIMPNPIKAVVPYKAAPVSDSPWDASAAEKRLKERAGDDMAKYEEGFAVVDGDKEEVGSYHLPHHDVEGEKFVTSKRGVIAAIAAVNGARGGYQGPDKEGALAHLKKHAAEWEDENDEPAKGYSSDADRGADEAAEGQDDIEDEPEDERDPIRRGDHVKCVKGAYKGVVGKCVSVHKGEMVPDVDDNVMGTKADPACRVKAYKARGDGHVPTDHHIGVKAAHLEKIEELEPPKRKTAKGVVIDTVQIEISPDEIKTDEQLKAERLAQLAAAGPIVGKAIAQELWDQMIGVV